MKIKIFKHILLLFAAVFFLFSGVGLYAQQSISTPVASLNGFVLKKTTSNTTVASGVVFSYTIDFTIPVGATNVMITDALPAGLVYMAHSFTAPCGAAPTVTVPAVNSNGVVMFTWASVPAGCTGSISISVMFPPGTTCNGDAARNRVCIKGFVGNVLTEFCTEFVSTTATAVNPWRVSKYLIGNASGGSCSNTAINDTVRYRICVYKDVGTTGQMNLFNGVINDILPVGAVLVVNSSTCGMTFAGNTITWNVGALSAVPMYNMVCCDFLVYYPPANFPNGTTITNSATLVGGLGSPSKPCGTFTQNSNTVSFQINIAPKSQIYKWVNTTGQPGCTGQYCIYICNNGGVTLNPFSITDNLPNTLTGYTIGSNSSNVSANILGNVLTANSTAALPPGGSAWIYVNFTIPLTATVGSTITNCATLSSPQLITPVTACASFVVKAPMAKPCVWKEVCSKKPAYLPGDMFIYRLRVQNIGGLAITGAVVTDVLSPYLTYVGPPTYYTSGTWNIGCSPAGTPWTGVTFSQSGQTLTFNLPPIPASCQSLFYGNSGQYGTSNVPFYFIEFKVMVKADAPIGVVPNNFTIAGGNLANPETSNTDYVNITGTTGFNLTKTLVAPVSGIVAPGGSVDFKLQMNISGTTALWRALSVDLLPRDHVPDRRLLSSCANRGSTADLDYQGPTTSVPGGVAGPRFHAGTNLNLNAVTVPSVTGTYFASSCTGGPVAGIWFWPLTPVTKNVGFLFNGALIPPTTTSIDFKAKMSVAAQNGQVACNSFAANAAKRFLINSTTLQYVAGTEQESNNVCVKVVGAFKCDTLVKPKFDPKCCNYEITVQNNSGSPISSIWYNVNLGSIQGASANGCTNTATIGATAGNFMFTPPCAINPQLYFDAMGNIVGWVSVQLTIVHASGDTCRTNFKFKCNNQVQDRCDSLVVKPFVFNNLNASGRTFTVFNLQNPASPICNIDIKVGTLVGTNFTTLPWWLGGGMVLPNNVGVNASAQFNSIGGQYSKLPSNQANVNVPTFQSVSFNLGVDYVYVNVGNVAVVLIMNHCDGTICRDTFRWGPVIFAPKSPSIMTGAANRSIDKVFADQIALRGGGDLRPIKYVAFRVPEQSPAEIFAVSAATLDAADALKRGTAQLIVTGQSAKTALFEFERPVVLERDELSPKINMVFIHALPELKYTYYDENGQELGTQTLHFGTETKQGSILQTSGNGLLEVFPTPATGRVNIRYELPKDGPVQLALYDAVGRLVRQLEDSESNAGPHNLQVDIQTLPAGTYFVRLTTEAFQATKPLIVKE